MKIERIFPEQPRRTLNSGQEPWYEIEKASWVWHPELSRGQYSVLEFQCSFTSEEGSPPMVFHLSADQRYVLLLDGLRVSLGPDCGDLWHYSYQSYEVTQLTPGDHEFRAMVWWAGGNAPAAHVSLRGGFIFRAEGDGWQEALTTGSGPWRVRQLPAYSHFKGELDEKAAFVGRSLLIDHRQEPGPWKGVKSVAPGCKPSRYGDLQTTWHLSPSIIPDQIDRRASEGRVAAVIEGGLEQGKPVEESWMEPTLRAKWQALLTDREEVTIPAHTTVSVLIDWEDYYCAYPTLTTRGGQETEITWAWAESLYQKATPLTGHDPPKADRHEVAGKTFAGVYDRFVVGTKPEQDFITLWWRAGKFSLLTIKTGDEELTITRLGFIETRYPLKNESSFEAEGRDFNKLIQLCCRGLQMCAHETYIDCPYYEQLMYLGDTRLQILVNYVMQHDDRLARKAIMQFNNSRYIAGGFTTSRYPCRYTEIIPTFSLIWIWMVHDFLFWRSDQDFVKSQLSGIRNLLSHFDNFLSERNLIEGLPPWLFVDWVRNWKNGVPPEAYHQPSSVVNLIYLQAVLKAEEIEEVCGSTNAGEELRSRSKAVAKAIMRHFWDEEKSLIADNSEKTTFCEHAQCLAQLSGLLDEGRSFRNLQALLENKELQPTTIYFRHYLFETLNLWIMPEKLLEGFAYWEELIAKGLKTPVEAPEPCRSDCHAWGSHPFFHLHASIMGVRPSAPNFSKVEVVPKLGPLSGLSARVPHPKGWITSKVDLGDGESTYSIELPDDVTGELITQKGVAKLHSGENKLSM